MRSANAVRTHAERRDSGSRGLYGRGDSYGPAALRGHHEQRGSRVHGEEDRGYGELGEPRYCEPWVNGEPRTYGKPHGRGLSGQNAARGRGASESRFWGDDVGRRRSQERSEYDSVWRPEAGSEHGRRGESREGLGFNGLETWRRFLDTLVGMSSSGVDSADDASARRQRLVALSFWAGVALAPIAALLLLLGQGIGPVRAAAVLAVLGVVLIGLSVTFRDDASAVRRELEEEFRHEVEQVREEVATLRRGVRITVNRELERVRGELDEARTVMHAEATRLPSGFPARTNALPPSQGLQRAVNGAGHVNGVRAANGAHVNGNEQGRESYQRAYAAHTNRKAASEYSQYSAGVNGKRRGAPVDVRTAEYSAVEAFADSGTDDGMFADIHTIEPIREKYAQAANQPKLLPPSPPNAPRSDAPARARVANRATPVRDSGLHDRGLDPISGDVLTPNSFLSTPRRASAEPRHDDRPVSRHAQFDDPFELPSLDHLPSSEDPLFPRGPVSQGRRGGRHSSD